MDQFKKDLAQLTLEISKDVDNMTGTLGDVIQQMGRDKQLLTKRKENEFRLFEINDLSDETRNYLNVLQIEKMFHCRSCYNIDDTERCWFHKKYLFLGPQTTNDKETLTNEYIDFLNTDMGIISFVELYYVCLMMELCWKHKAPKILYDLTGRFSINELLHTHDETNDKPLHAIMECE
jgi:hypothetical protein